MGQGLKNAKLGMARTGGEHSSVLGSPVLPKENPQDEKNGIDGSNPKVVKDDLHVN